MMKPYEWMTRYTPQHEWIEKKGIFMPLAFYFGSLGGGLYLVSLYFSSLLGMVIAWLVVGVFKGGSHLIDLGRPFRSWRIILRPQTSWISRGLILVILFLGFVPIQLFLFYFFPGTIWETVVKVLAGIAAFGTCVYPGFTLNYVNAIPLWNSAILPLVFIACGFLGGFALLLLIGMLGANVDLAMVEFGSMVFLIITALIIVVFTSSVSYLGPSGKKALKDLLQGRASLAFWVGVVLIGIIMPFTIAFLGYVNVYDSKVILFFALVGEIICGLSLTYVILRAGAYSPLIPNNAYEG
jgi:formate-dependent nitrite reductase membrane component NrfD